MADPAAERNRHPVLIIDGQRTLPLFSVHAITLEEMHALGRGEVQFIYAGVNDV